MALSLIPYLSKRCTVNFFMRRSAKELWKTVTNVSPAGRKKGRLKSRTTIINLNQRQRMGVGSMTASFPGLNEQIKRGQSLKSPITVTTYDAEPFEDRLKHIDQYRANTGKRMSVDQKLHPLERGFSGIRLVGQNLGPPTHIEGHDFQGFRSYCLDVKRTSVMTGKVGRKASISTLVVTGNGAGLFGWTVGVGPVNSIMTTVLAARNKAGVKLCRLELLDDRTVFHDFYAETNNTRLWVQRKPANFGLVVHSRLAKICEVIGIKDLYVKVEGSTKNYRALNEAFLTGLLNQETHQQLAERTKLHVVETRSNTMGLPKVIASPTTASVRAEADVQPIEKLTLDEYYGEGRYPYRRPTPKPFYYFTEHHQKKLMIDHPYRNMENVKIRLLADGLVTRWTRTQRHAWGNDKHLQATRGIIDIPKGIGLSIIDRENREQDEQD